MRLAKLMLPLFLVAALLQPAKAATPQLFGCRADITLTFGLELVSQLAWQWWISSLTGTCNTVPASQKYDVTIAEEGSPVLASEPGYEQNFGFEVKLRLRGRVTGERRAYRHIWYGARINCVRAPFVAMLRGLAPVGSGNMRYCGPIPDLPSIPEENQPASVTWTFVGT